MTTYDLDALKYPIGALPSPDQIEEHLLDKTIDDIKQFPERLENAISGITDEQLNWLYRPMGWSIKQVVHHCADSHMNAISRFKLALTEDNPIIKPYLEAEWAQLVDANLDELMHSLQILKGLHFRWGTLLDNMTPDQLNNTYFHPEHNKSFDLKYTIFMYGWHCNHHLAHVKQALQFKNNFK